MNAYSKAAVAGRAAAIGFVGGLRSQMPLALLAIAARRRDGSPDASGLAGLLGKPAVAAGLCLAAAGEVLVDKLPFVPSRLEPRSLVGRLFIGALAGAGASGEMRSTVVAGALFGAAGALGGSYAGYHARRYLARVRGVPDPLVAVVEDATAIGLGSLVTRNST